jgi:hypothetical protein
MTMRVPTVQLRAMTDQLVDAAVDRYIDWREQSRTAITAYETWTSAPSSQRRLAFAAYQAALDHEHHAATHYASAIEAVERVLTD